jgi:hypothetical protein
MKGHITEVNDKTFFARLFWNSRKQTVEEFPISLLSQDQLAILCPGIRFDITDERTFIFEPVVYLTKADIEKARAQAKEFITSFT